MVGAQPCMEIVAKENTVTIMDHMEGRRTEEFAEDPLVIPRRIMEKWTPQLLDELPEAFCGISNGLLIANLFYNLIMPSWFCLLCV